MQNQRSKVKKNTIKIGYFVRQFRKSVSILYFKGVYQACLDNNATLIIGTAGEHFDEIKESYDSDIEFFKLNLFNKNYFDGIIARTSSLNYCFNNDINELKIFLEKFKPLPIVNIGLPVFDYPTLVTENIISTKKIMEHLIIDHGYRHIAFVKGGYNHFSGEERFKTYLETLSQYNIPINYDLISPQCYYSEYSAIKAFDFFNEKFKKNILIPGKNIQAIVTTSDVHAIPLIKMLKNAGIKVPEEIAITGFNNSNESQFTDPDITTVDQDFFQIGYRAVEILLHMIKFKEVPKFNPYIPVKIIIRKSCGCKDLSINNVTDKKNIITITKENFKTVFYNIFSHSINDKFNKLNYYNSKFLSKEILSELFNCFINDIINDNSETFLLNFSNIVLFNNEDNYEYLIFQKFFTDLWNLLNYNYADNNLKNKIYEIISKTNFNLNTDINTFMVKNFDNFHKFADILRKINISMSNTFNAKDIFANLEHILKQLGISEFYIFIYKELGNYKSPSKLIFGYKNYNRLEINEEYFDTQVTLIPENIFDNKKNHILLFDPLIFKKLHIGYIIYEIKNQGNTFLGYIYEILTSIISSSYYGAIILDEIKKAENDRENFFKILESQNNNLEKAIQSANQANLEKSTFFTNISHDFKTPLSVIIGLAEKIQLINNKSEQDKYCNLIINESSKLTDLINQLLDISKLESGKLIIQNNIFDLKKLLFEINDTYKIIANKKNLNFKLSFDNDLPDKIIGDEIRLRQVIINLIGNAIKFTNEGEVSITVNIRNKINDKVLLLFKISDTGIGIAKEKQKYIFDIFTQAEESISYKYGGSGLGTAIAKQIIELMNGEIGVDSTVGKGTTFWFSIWFEYIINYNINENHLTEKKNNNNRQLDNFFNHKILLVEDNTDQCKILNKFLQEKGFNISFLENFINDYNRVLLKEYDLVIIDLMLNYIDKYDVIKSFRNNNNKIPILVLSSINQIEQKEKILNLGADDYISQPFKKEDLLSKIYHLLEKKRINIENIIKISDLEIDLGLKRVKKNDKIINLTPIEFKILSFLANNKGNIVNKLSIGEHIWGQDIDYLTLSHYIDIHMKNIRKKLHSDSDNKILLTKRGIGFILTDKINPTY